MGKIPKGADIPAKDDAVTTSPMKAIRLHCLECSGDSYKEVKLCVNPECIIYPYRFGVNPYNKKSSYAKKVERKAYNATA